MTADCPPARPGGRRDPAGGQGLGRTAAALGVEARGGGRPVVLRGGGNGAAMRGLPRALALAGRSAAEVARDAVLDGAATHGHPEPCSAPRRTPRPPGSC